MVSDGVIDDRRISDIDGVCAWWCLSKKVEHRQLNGTDKTGDTRLNYSDSDSSGCMSFSSKSYSFYQPKISSILWFFAFLPCLVWPSNFVTGSL